MKQKVSSLITHPIITGGSILFVGALVANFLSYVLNIIMGRLLTVTEYGTLTSLSSLMILISVFSVSFSSIIAKFSAKYYGSHNEHGTNALVRYGLKFIFIFAVAVCTILVLSIPLISSFLHIHNTFYLLLVIFSIFGSLTLSLPLGVLQGRLKFYLYSALNITQPIIRITVSVALVIVGWSVTGPLLGLALASILPAIIGITYLYRRYRIEKNEKFDHAEFRKSFIHHMYTFILSGVGVTLLSNSDIILVKHYFSGVEAGQYAALSLMGKAIFYFTSPIQNAFFPIIAVKHEKKESLLSTVFLASGIISFASIMLSFAYFVFPKLVLAMFFPAKEYQTLIPYLGIFSLYILVFSLANLFNSFYLSTGKTSVYKVTVIAAIVQIGGIILFHKTMFEIIIILFVVSSSLFLYFLTTFILNERNK